MLVRRPSFLLTFFITVPRFTTAATRFQPNLLLVTSRALPLQSSRLTIYLMPKLITAFALIATITRYTASAAKDLRSRSRTNSITAPTLISFEHYTQLLETSTLKPESYGQWPKLQFSINICKWWHFRFSETQNGFREILVYLEGAVGPLDPVTFLSKQWRGFPTR